MNTIIVAILIAAPCGIIGGVLGAKFGFWLDRRRHPRGA